MEVDSLDLDWLGLFHAFHHVIADYGHAKGFTLKTLNVSIIDLPNGL